MTPPAEQPELAALIMAFLRDELELPKQPPQVVVYNSAWNIPQDSKMYLVVGILSEDNFGAGSGYRADVVSGKLVNDQILAQSTTLTVDVFSTTPEARRRLPEIFFALTGDAAERLMERYNLRIFRPEQFTDLSALEASRMLNRFQTRFAVYQGFGQSKAVPAMIPKKPYIKTLVEA